MTVREGTWPTPAGNVAHFLWRDDAIDWNTIESICRGPFDPDLGRHQDEYHLPAGLDGWALDLGAYVGAAAVCLALDNPGLRVIAVEPVPDNVRLVHANCALNGISSRVTVLSGAVGVGHLVYGYMGEDSMTAEQKAATPYNRFVANAIGVAGRPGESVDVPVYTLHDLAELADGPIRFCKIDVEGGEWGLFGAGGLDLVDTWAGEWHGIPGHPGGEELLDIFGPTHRVEWAEGAVRKDADGNEMRDSDGRLLFEGGGFRAVRT